MAMVNRAQETIVRDKVHALTCKLRTSRRWVLVQSLAKDMAGHSRSRCLENLACNLTRNLNAHQDDLEFRTLPTLFHLQTSWLLEPPPWSLEQDILGSSTAILNSANTASNRQDSATITGRCNRGVMEHGVLVTGKPVVFCQVFGPSSCTLAALVICTQFAGDAQESGQHLPIQIRQDQWLLKGPGYGRYMQRANRTIKRQQKCLCIGGLPGKRGCCSRGCCPRGCDCLYPSAGGTTSSAVATFHVPQRHASTHM
ncbi:hypothetical protein BDP81DRAFT_15478 [Colletotrichum phormii]|uniref:Uncharacterized protein n=1 Tax=Colletotrichum phormii TaxID=359342 RepID=A0AAJ0EP01_9PEZI|nr:uncharacterized protein BDP81DRAFT_15478 [Colletotrichum phormii]KAK1656104.1 hypothetical protein BDP81DRAFT_15478 [Colletotrichum phormii]